MSIETALALFLAMVICAATPGPGVFACIAKAIGSGFRASIYVICGIVAGNVVFLLFAILGLSVVAQMLGDLFVIIKLTGGAYLFWLGWKMWRTEPDVLNDKMYLGEEKRGSNFIGGLIVPFSNPKVILFYVSLLPSFVDLSTLSFFDCLYAAGLIALALTAVLSVYAFAASRMRHLVAGHRAARNLNRGAGATMMGTGVVIAVQSN